MALARHRVATPFIPIIFLPVFADQLRKGVKINLNLGSEIGYVEKVLIPSDLRDPEGSRLRLMTPLEKLYIRFLGIPDTIKQQQAREIFSILANLKFSSVLDIGCGQGYVATMIAKNYPQCNVKGIDINQNKINIGNQVKKKFGLSNLTFEQADFCSAVIKDKYDLVVMLQVIEHIEDDTRLLEKIRRTIKKDGHLILTGPNSESPIINWEKHNVTIESHVRDGYTTSELIQKILNAGFTIKQVEQLSGMIGQTIEKTETNIKINLPFIFPMAYPFLYYLSFLDDYLKLKVETSSGILIVAGNTVKSNFSRR
jgi:2-polyprenyl-3-methyl-5-hydroxy-6-metoxy-1,4-benzoquinol methylase